MGTFRFNPIVLFVVFSLACMSRESTPAAAEEPPVEVAKIQRIQIEHLVPKPNFVGKTPTVMQWTAAEGADSYVVSVENEIEIPVFDQEDIKGTSIPWPKEARVDPGTYYWRIIGLKDGRLIADSGRAAFVVMEP
jgi:hypothetical protein